MHGQQNVKISTDVTVLGSFTPHSIHLILLSAYSNGRWRICP